MVLANFPFEEHPELCDLADFRAELHSDVFSVIRQLADLRQRSEQVMLSVAALYNNVDRKVAATYQRLLEDQPDESRVVIGHSGHRNQCLKVLKEARKQVIIVNPWITRYGINDEMIQGMIDCLEREVHIDMGWGFQRDIGSIIKPGNGYWSFSTPMPWQYNAINELQKLRKSYPNTFRLKLIGTHAKVFLCENFAVVGSCNVLCSKPRKSDDYREELGLLTTERRDIATLIDWFKKAPNLAEHKAKTHIA
ncbi:hypothetical protein H6F50_16035 [Coleofasciculus sp. FACHB-712]|uniref:hypothetical protein n=1 Tax=Cyanophyceae TaxID=3028117 RepID=UPI001689CCE4|nr:MULTISPECIES: hypothetical protein [unclassified Coleofasciculus]MBD1943849.1 hypothetical protein [Coleofasciculus sp. FACHB-712]MBD2538401.1 hypothetical protein [Coleofasciculus sp. FACHB-SPT36]